MRTEIVNKSDAKGRHRDEESFMVPSETRSI